MKQLVLHSVFLSVFLGATFAMSGCSTLGEAVNPNDSTSGYVKTKNKKGETVYRRERVVEDEPRSLPWTAPDHWQAPPPLPPQAAPSLPPEPPIAMDQLMTEPTQLGDATQTSPQLLTQPLMPPSPPPTPTLAPPAATPEPVDHHDGFAFGAEFSSDSKRTHVGAMLFKEIGPIEAKLGVSLFHGANDWYAGFDLGLRPEIKFNNIALFGGLGIYGGDTKRCASDDSTELCEKKFLFAGYLEAGVYLWNVSIFARTYNIEEAGKQIPSDTFYGVGLRSSF